MEDNDIITIPYAVYESSMDREDRKHERLVIIIIVLIILLFASHIGWLIAWSQYDYVSTEEYEIEASQDGNGVNIIGRDINGTDCQNQSEKE